MEKPVTLILGLGQLVGEAIARRCVEAGQNVVMADPEPKRLERAAEALGERAIAHHEALHTRLGLRNCIAAAIEAYGRVDHIVSIPVIPQPAALSAIQIDEFEKAHNKAVRGATLALNLFSKELDRLDEQSANLERRVQRGTVTMVLTLAGQVSNPGQYAETVTQHALLGVVQAGAIELAPKQIRVNAICAVRPRAEKQEPWLKTRTPMGRAAQAGEIASACLYLASEQSAIITGETLMMDGGRSRLGGVIDS